MNTNISTPIRALRDRKGGVLISVIAVMLIIGVLGAAVITFTHSSEHSFLSANAGSRAYYLADSGLRYAQQIHCDSLPDGWLHGRQRTLTLQGGEQVVVVRIANTFWATAVVDAGTAQEARARVPMPMSLCGIDPDANPADEFAVFGDTGIALGTNTIIQGNVAITDDDVDIRGDIQGNVLANDIGLTGHGTVSGDIYSSGEVDVTRGTVTGDIHSTGGIAVTSAESTVEGWLFSNGEIDVGGGAQVLGHIHSCGGDVLIGGNGTILGTVTDPIEIRTTGSVYLSGTAIVNGTIYAGGIIEMKGSASIVGADAATVVAVAGGAITIGNNNTVTGLWLENSATYLEDPICPNLANLEDLNLPDGTEFTAGGADISVPLGTELAPTDYVLAPGIHGALTMPDNTDGYTRLYLNAGMLDHGNYYFDSITFGSDAALYLDLSAGYDVADLSAGYDIRIFIVGNVAIGGAMNVFISTDGATYTSMTDALIIDPQIASRVYWEPHGSFNLGSQSNWFGTVYTVDDNLRVGNGSYLIGSYYSGGGHDIIQSTVVHVAPNYFAEE